MNNNEIIGEIGRRLKRERLSQNITVADLAQKSGVGESTVRKIESGQPTSISILVSLLRGLGKLQQLDQFLPEPQASPLSLAKRKSRQRATGRRRRSLNADS